MTKRGWRAALMVATLALLLAACGSGETSDTEAAVTETETIATPDELTSIKLQLQWFAQAQFAGYYAAVDQGFYEDEGLDVEILQGAVDIVPQQVVSTGGAEFGLAWVPKALVSNEAGAGLVNVGQVFQRSGTLMVSWADTGIESPEDWSGKSLGNWGFGNEFELTAAIAKFGVTDHELVAQNFDMEALLNRDIDAAEAMIYNEYAQVLEATNETTGELYQASDLAVIDFNEIGTAMLQDSVWTTEDYANDNPEIVESFLKASFRGWIYCRDNPDSCVDIVLAQGPTLPRTHQAWQMNEVNALIWPSGGGIGMMDQALWDQTVEIATTQIPELQGVEIPESSFRSDLAEKAVAALEADGLDTIGAGFTKATIELTEGGE